MSNFSHFSTGKNKFFDMGGDNYQSERDLMSILINEFYNKYGVCMEYYIVSYDKKYDRIFGEDNNRRYERHFECMSYYTLQKEDKMWSKFGIEGINELTLYISKRHFAEVSKDANHVPYQRPQIGDIIKSDFDNYFYEITEVAEDTGMFFQSTQHVWEVVVKPMKDEYIDFTNDTSASDIAEVTNIKDIFDIRDDVDIEKPDIVYKPAPTEKPNDDPFGNW